MCTVYTGYHGPSEVEHGLCACMVDNPLAKAREFFSPYRYTVTMLCLSLVTDPALISVPGHVAQLVGHLTHKSEVQSSIPGLATSFRFSIC